jgi:hypothetical protein
MIDYAPPSFASEFAEAELEIVAPPSAFALGEELYSRAFGELEREGAQLSLRSKYSRAIELLDGG